MKRTVIGLGIALGVLAALSIAVMAGAVAGGVSGYLSGRHAARLALPRLPEEELEERPDIFEPRTIPPQEMFGLPEWGLRVALVTEVVAGGPADEAGLEEEDVIIAVENEALDEGQELSDLIRRHDPGDEVVLTVLRRRDHIDIFEVEVTLGRDRDEEGEVVAYLGIWYQEVAAGIPAMPRTPGPWD